MTTYLNNRDGGKTNEEGHLRFQAKAWSGNIVSGLQAVQRSPLAMGINISVGDAKVDYSTYGYSVWIDAIEAVGITTADPSNPRIDRIVGYVDRSVTPSSANSNNPGLLKFMAVAGTPAASPAAPSNVTVQAAVGASNPYFNIANILVGTGVTTIDNTKITDTRVFISAALANMAVKAQNIDFTTLLLADINTVTAGSNYNSSTFTDITQLNGTSIIAPLTGKVHVTGIFTISNQTSSIPDNFIQILVGTTASKSAKITTPTRYQGANLSIDSYITGLTPGTSYSVKAQCKNSTSSDVYYDTEYCSIKVYSA